MYKNLSKKAKYLIYSAVLAGLLYAFSVVPASDRGFVFLITIVAVFLGNFLSQYPFVRWVNYIINLIPPMSLVVATVLALVFFPNLSYGFKLLGILFFGILLYIYLLVNNIFLVVVEKREVIPLYRAAITWSEIILTVMAIPLYAGIFKLNIGFIPQALLTGAVSLLFVVYVLWTVLLDTDAKKIDIKERGVLLLLDFYLITSAKLALSFLQTEAFLSAILISALLMFSLSYIQGHLKNSITKNLITQFFFIISVFLLILLVYLP